MVIILFIIAKHIFLIFVINVNLLIENKCLKFNIFTTILSLPHNNYFGNFSKLTSILL